MRRRCWSLLCLVALCCCLPPSASSDKNELRAGHRARRYLLFPYTTSIYELIIGFGMPIEAPMTAVTMGVAVKYIYSLPGNSSVFFEPYVTFARRNARWSIYTVLGELISRLGTDGRACVLRAICEAAEVPVSKLGGLTEELVHLVFTPSTTREDDENAPERDYHAAERDGRTGAGCERYRKTCDLDLLGLVSVLRPRGESTTTPLPGLTYTTHPPAGPAVTTATTEVTTLESCD